MHVVLHEDVFSSVNIRFCWIISTDTVTMSINGIKTPIKHHPPRPVYAPLSHHDRGIWNIPRTSFSEASAGTTGRHLPTSGWKVFYLCQTTVASSLKDKTNRFSGTLLDLLSQYVSHKLDHKVMWSCITVWFGWLSFIGVGSENVDIQQFCFPNKLKFDISNLVEAVNSEATFL